MTTTEQIEQSLATLVKQARRCQYVVHRFEADDLTDWDAKHRAIDVLIDQHRRAKAGEAVPA